ncbi:HD domain-containing protein [Taibaiella lutea]|uniref:HD domain-containing protein n=1 Tax=Taibaiella lutea TaxID=2608001 RepID=A0A5M6CMP8_9BACT|nr:Pycsar system effector family protein [Taibaiella lutea]KAA5536478.1 HD domain-containing protein [Taibaiella lutea]
MDYKLLQTKVEEYVRNYFATHTDGRLFFHNLQHTQDVVRAAMQIGDHYQLNENDYAVLITAAWFHDIGYFTEAARHEEISADLVTDFLNKNGIEDPSFTAAVVSCIRATKMPQSPKHLIEEILCDADLFHLGTDSFSDKNSALRKEKEAFKGDKINKTSWREGNIKFMTEHRYFTDYARLLLDDEKEKHLSKLREKVAEKSEEDDKPKKDKPEKSIPVVVAEAVTEKPKKDKNRPEKGIETMFRITSNNNQRLSDMADNKAHIMITVNSIILSAVISLLLNKLDHNPHLAIPTYMTLGVSVSAIIFSILATRPSIPKGKFTQQDMEAKTVNLLFFGNFYKMNLNDYADGMHQVMEDKEFLYDSLIRDVYSQGVVLGRKYRLLRISYSIFMFGLILAVLSFIIASIFFA